MERYGVSLRIQYAYGKIRTRKTLNMDTIYAVHPIALKVIKKQKTIDETILSRSLN